MNVEPPEMLVIIESIVYKSNGFAIAILNDSTRYQSEPGNADPEEEPRL